MALVIRSAEPDDADAIANAHVTAWRVAYRGVVPDAYLDSDAFADGRLAGWRRMLTETRSPERDPLDEVFVPVIDGRVVGFAHVGEERERGTDQGELYGFYLHPDAWGSGAATALIDASHIALRERFSSALLWVLRENPRARRFYERSGWSCGTGDEIIEDFWEGPTMNDIPSLPAPLAEIQYRIVFTNEGR
jgi:GNAT superfamily N-acetyltransferase